MNDVELSHAQRVRVVQNCIAEMRDEVAGTSQRESHGNTSTLAAEALIRALGREGLEIHEKDDGDGTLWALLGPADSGYDAPP